MLSILDFIFVSNSAFFNNNFSFSVSFCSVLSFSLTSFNSVLFAVNPLLLKFNFFSKTLEAASNLSEGLITASFISLLAFIADDF